MVLFTASRWVLTYEVVQQGIPALFIKRLLVFVRILRDGWTGIALAERTCTLVSALLETGVRRFLGTRFCAAIAGGARSTNQERTAVSDFFPTLAHQGPLQSPYMQANKLPTSSVLQTRYCL